MTHLGGFFIKRKLDTAAGKDVLYRKCLHEVRLRNDRLLSELHVDPLSLIMIVILRSLNEFSSCSIYVPGV